MGPAKNSPKWGAGTSSSPQAYAHFYGSTKRGIKSLDKEIRRYVFTCPRLLKYPSIGIFNATPDSGSLVIHVPVFNIPVTKRQRIVNISSGDDPFVVILGRQTRMVSLSKNIIPLRSKTELLASLNEQLVLSVYGRVLIPGNTLSGRYDVIV